MEKKKRFLNILILHYKHTITVAMLCSLLLLTGDEETSHLFPHVEL